MNKTKTFVVGAMVAAALLSACGDDKKSDGGSGLLRQAAGVQDRL